MKTKKKTTKKTAKKTPAKKLTKKVLTKEKKKVPLSKKSTKKAPVKVKRVDSKKKDLTPVVANGAVVMDPVHDTPDPVDITAQTVGQTSAKVGSDGVVKVEAESEKVEADPVFESKVSITKTKDGMIVVDPVIDKR